MAGEKGTLIYFSGMGLGQEFLSVGHMNGWRVVVPEWPTPEYRESLADYSRRIIQRIESFNPTHLAGVSFGAPVALEIARSLNVRGVVIVAGPMSPKDIRWYFRILRHVYPQMLVWLLRLAFILAAMIVRWFSPLLSSNAKGFFKYFLMADRSFVEWGVSSLLNWKPCPCIGNLPVLRVHGGRDYIFAASSHHDTRFISDGGHALTATHAVLVNQFIYEFIKR
ncbi:MAG: alpha/beta hydrolase [Kiritimatiellales bacterium]|jgi:pimeloyl-ACP methyl ester carboxylesterase